MTRSRRTRGTSRREAPATSGITTTRVNDVASRVYDAIAALPRPLITYQRARALGYSGLPEGLSNPDTREQLGVKHVRALLRDFAGNVELAVAAHFAGPSMVLGLAARYGNTFEALRDHLPDETRVAASEVLSRVRD